MAAGQSPDYFVGSRRNGYRERFGASPAAAAADDLPRQLAALHRASRQVEIVNRICLGLIAFAGSAFVYFVADV